MYEKYNQGHCQAFLLDSVLGILYNHSGDNMSADNDFEQRINFGRLYNFYGGLLTERQKKVMEEYFYNDLSLGEIAEENGVTRQAIHDLLKRVEQILERYEARLGLLARNDKDKEALGRAQELLTLYIAEGNTDRRLVKAQQIIIDLSNEGR